MNKKNILRYYYLKNKFTDFFIYDYVLENNEKWPFLF